MNTPDLCPRYSDMSMPLYVLLVGRIFLVNFKFEQFLSEGINAGSSRSKSKEAFMDFYH